MSVYVNTFFETRLIKLLDLANLIEAAFSGAGLEYRVVGGLATYLYVEDHAEGAGRLTRDVDIAVRREDLPEIIRVVEPFGFRYKQVAGVDMFVQVADPTARGAVHIVFTGEKVRAHYPEAAPQMRGSCVVDGIRLAPVEDLIRMKLTSFRLKDQMHLKDLDDAGLITAEVEADLPLLYRERLAAVRASA